MQNEQAKSIFQIRLTKELAIVFKWRLFSNPVNMTQVNSRVKQHMGLLNLNTTN